MNFWRWLTTGEKPPTLSRRGFLRLAGITTATVVLGPVVPRVIMPPVLRRPVTGWDAMCAWRLWQDPGMTVPSVNEGDPIAVAQGMFQLSDHIGPLLIAPDLSRRPTLGANGIVFNEKSVMVAFDEDGLVEHAFTARPSPSSPPQTPRPRR